MTKVIKGINDLETFCLENGLEHIINEWDVVLNSPMVPSSFAKASHESVYWTCPKGHPSYPARIANRVYKNYGCPICAGRKLLPGQNDLMTVNPVLASQWDYERNAPKKPDEVFPHEGKEYWWICPICNESYKATVANRAAGKNHKKCTQKGTSFPEQAIYYYLKKHFPSAINRDSSFGFELDIYVPEAGFAVEYDGIQYHKTAESLVKDNNKDIQCKRNGIILYRFRDDRLPETSDAIKISCNYLGKRGTVLNDSIAELFSYVQPNIKPDIDTSRDYYDILSTTLIIQKDKSIVSTHPEIAAQWHPTRNLPLTPDKVTSGMGVYIWWKCDKGHRPYRSVMYQKKTGTGCPECAALISAEKHSETSANKNSFIRLYPDLAKEIAIDLNPELDVSKIAAGSHKRIMWRCNNCSNTYLASINHRVNGSGCKVCGREKTIAASERRVRNLDTGEVFSSLTKAAEFCSGDKRGISDCCQGRRKTAYGYRWEYCDSMARKRHDGMIVYNNDTGEKFSTIQDAADKYHCDRSSISSALRGKTKTSQGYHWKWISDEQNSMTNR